MAPLQDSLVQGNQRRGWGVKGQFLAYWFCFGCGIFFNEDKTKQNKARITLSWTEDLVVVGVGTEGWNDEMKSFWAKFSFPCSPPPLLNASFIGI